MTTKTLKGGVAMHERILFSRQSDGLFILRRKLGTNGYLFSPEFNKNNLLPLLSQFGKHRPQEDGQPFYVVRAGEKLQPVDGGSLMPHTDDFNSPSRPPRLVALHCINPSTGTGGKTLIADGYTWLRELTPKKIELLKRLWRYKRGDGFVERPFLSTTRILRV
ncbi:TauD/TfdA family dioxygenase, partial [Candidatus Azambacteria bacterium]|nr:TauD/TfdA family dioxygenase [Candidatus Azambacteria bacterium]